MGRLTPWKWVMDQWTSLPPVPQFFSGDLGGKTVIVTGANTGVGLAAAHQFAALGPKKLILGCRDSMKGERAVCSIRDTTGYQAVESWDLDLADFSSIRGFVRRFEQEGDGHLDLLVENAGVWLNHYTKTPDGWETSVQVNYLGPSLLALLMLPALLKAPDSPPTPRLVIVTSESHFFIPSFPEAKAPNILEKLNDEDYCTSPKVMVSRYPTTKLMIIFFMRALASRLPTPPAGALTVACATPGFCRSELARWVAGPLLLIKYVAELLFARTTQVGSYALLWAALGGESSKVHGRYTSTCKIEDESDLILLKDGPETEERLWNETIDVLSKVDFRIKEIVDEHLSSH
ncbi:NAD(P)-binding protein [Ramaria rubella]|nr:NAD(P)-binding protein [Ramaria rubella]